MLGRGVGKKGTRGKEQGTRGNRRENNKQFGEIICVNAKEGKI